MVCKLKQNLVDDCIVISSMEVIIFLLVLYVDDIFLAHNDIRLLYKTKRFLAKNFKIKDLGDASFVFCIKI